MAREGAEPKDQREPLNKEDNKSTKRSGVGRFFLSH